MVALTHMQNTKKSDAQLIENFINSLSMMFKVKGENKEKLRTLILSKIDEDCMDYSTYENKEVIANEC